MYASQHTASKRITMAFAIITNEKKMSTTTKTVRHNCWGQSPGWIQTFSRTLTGILFYQRNPFIPRMTLTLLYVREIDWSRWVTYCQLFDLKRVKSCWANNHLQKRTIKSATPYLSLHSLSAYNIAKNRNCQLPFPISQFHNHAQNAPPCMEAQFSSAGGLQKLGNEVGYRTFESWRTV